MDGDCLISKVMLCLDALDWVVFFIFLTSEKERKNRKQAYQKNYEKLKGLITLTLLIYMESSRFPMSMSIIFTVFIRVIFDEKFRNS